MFSRGGGDALETERTNERAKGAKRRYRKRKRGQKGDSRMITPEV